MGSQIRKVMVHLVLGATLLSACSMYSTPEITEADIPRAPDDLLASASALAHSHLEAIDNKKWQFNAETNVYWQTGLMYASTPPSPESASLGIFVPAEYMHAAPNPDGQTYTAEVDPDGKKGNYTGENAPWVLPINSPGFAAIPAPNGYVADSKTYTDQGFIYLAAGARGLNAGAPTGVADLKAAIRYVRANRDAVPGNEQELFAFGMSGGGAQAAVLGASGNSKLYSPYLKQMGAVEGANDAIAGVMAWCPISTFDSANAEYEWQFTAARQGLEGLAQNLSHELAASYATHINALSLKDSAGKDLTLERSDQGIYHAGSYYQYVKGLVEQSLTTFLSSQVFPYTAPDTGAGHGRPQGGGDASARPNGTPPAAPADGSGTPRTGRNGTPNPPGKQPGERHGIDLSGKTFASPEDYVKALNVQGEWVRFDASAKRVTITSLTDFVKRMKVPTKTVGAFDGLDAQQPENQLFGFGDGKGVHFDPTMAALLDGTEYQDAFTKDLEKVDSVGSNIGTRVDMYNPLYYLNKHYLGFESGAVAPRWRIRSGIHQGDTALTTETNLALALQQYSGVKEVDYAAVWGHGHDMAEVSGDPTDNFIKWVHAQEKSGE